MAITTYTELKTAVSNFAHRDDFDFTSRVDEFIDLAEADLQVRAELGEFDTSASVTITSGSGTLPSDFMHATSVLFGGQTGTLQYITPDHYDDYAAANASGSPLFYTVRGTTLLVTPASDGTVTLKYRARFTALSDSATTNSLLTLFPDAYLSGALMHAANWAKDQEEMNRQAALFEAAVRRIRSYMLRQKYPNGLQMRAA